MNKVEYFIKKLDEVILEDQENTLIKLGLTEKEYSPDGQRSYIYDKYEYVNGEQKYYREVAMKITDEEYSIILDKVKRVEEIKAREEIELQKKRKRTSTVVVKQWMPNYTKKKDDARLSNTSQGEDTGKSILASILRIIAWIVVSVSVVTGIVVGLSVESFISALMYMTVGAGILLLLYSYSAVLDYLAEITAIARNGFSYRETNK